MSFNIRPESEIQKQGKPLNPDDPEVQRQIAERALKLFNHHSGMAAGTFEARHPDFVEFKKKVFPSMGSGLNALYEYAKFQAQAEICVGPDPDMFSGKQSEQATVYTTPKEGKRGAAKKPSVQKSGKTRVSAPIDDSPLAKEGFLPGAGSRRNDDWFKKRNSARAAPKPQR